MPTRAQINRRIDREIMGQPVRTPPDYVATRTSMRPVRDRLRTQQNWNIVYTDGTGAVVVPRDATLVTVSREWVRVVQRDARTQKAVEGYPLKAGGVVAGDDSYERREGHSASNAIPMVLTSDGGDTVTRPLEVAALTLLAARKRPPRPPRDRDL